MMNRIRTRIESKRATQPAAVVLHVASGPRPPLTAGRDAPDSDAHTVMHLDSVESAGGRLGAVLSAPRSGAVALGRHGPWLVTTPALARAGADRPGRFDFPGDVSRSGDLSVEPRRDPLGPRHVRAADPGRGGARGRRLRPRVGRRARRARPQPRPARRTTPWSCCDARWPARPWPRCWSADVRTRDLVADLTLALDRRPRSRHLGPATAPALEPRTPRRAGRPLRPRGRPRRGPRARRRRPAGRHDAGRRACRCRSPQAPGCWGGSPPTRRRPSTRSTRSGRPCA